VYSQVIPKNIIFPMGDFVKFFGSVLAILFPILL